METDSASWDSQRLAVYLIAFVLAIGPFFNGMFFEPIRLLGAALPCVAFWLWYVRRQRAAIRWNGLDLMVLIWFLSYVLASVNPVLPRGHLSVMLDMAAFVAVYTVIRSTPAMEQSLTRILVGSGLAMATLSVAHLAGANWLNRQIVDLVISGRLSGGFQYPNTFAVWLFCLTLLAFREARTPRLGSLFLLAGGLFAGCFMLTLSRGALVAAPAAYLAVILLSSGENRVFTFWGGLLTWGPAFLLGSAAVRAFQQHQPALGLALVAACGLPPLATPDLTRLTEYVWLRKRIPGIATGTALLVVLLSAAAVGAGKVLPKLQAITANRLTSGYALSDANVFTRLMFSDWAWGIMSANHFLGAGGRSWTRLYFQAQSFPYFTTEVHDHFLQTGVEAGLLGLLAFTALFVLCLVTAWRSRKERQADNSLAVWAGVVTYLGIHSAFDFDLSYISLLLLLAIAIGVVSSRSVATPGAAHRWVPAWHHTLAAATAVAFVTAGALYVSHRAVLASDQAWVRGDVPGTVARLKLAQRTDPLSAEPWLRMAALKAAAGPADPGLPATKVLLTKAHALDPDSPQVTLDLADIALHEHRWADGADLAMKADSLMPLDQDVNAAVASMLWSAASGAVQAGDMPTVHALAERFTAYDAALKQRFAQAAPYARYARAPVGYTDITRLRLGEGLLLGGNDAAAAEHLRSAAKAQALKAEAEQWLYVALDQGGNKQEAEKLRQANPNQFTPFLQSALYRKVAEATRIRPQSP